MFTLTLLTLTTMSISLFNDVFSTPAGVGGSRQRRQLQSSDQLTNPCRLSDLTAHRTRTQEQRDRAKELLVTDLKLRPGMVHGTAGTLVSALAHCDCESLQSQPPIARIPTADVRSNVPLDALKEFYDSLLNHTAHIYFISEQFSRYSEHPCHEGSPETEVDNLSGDMLQLMCQLRMTLITLSEDEMVYDDEFFRNLQTKILSEQLEDSPACSTRDLKHCLSVCSTLKLMTEMTSYLRDNELTS